MRCDIRVGEWVWHEVVDYLLASRSERMAYLLARAARWVGAAGQPALDLLVVRGLLVPDAALAVQSSVRVEVDPAFTREVLITCFEAGLSLVDRHTHPFATTEVFFSSHDVSNMRATHTEFLRRVPDHPPVGVASLVVGHASVAGSFTDTATAQLRPLSRLTLLGDHSQEVPLCGKRPSGMAATTGRYWHSERIPSSGWAS